MKTRKNQLLFFALMAFFLLAGKVNAENSERQVASGLEMKTEIEPLLTLETWMLNHQTCSGELTLYQRETENDLELKEWMFHPAPLSDLRFCAAEDTESILEIETWMFNAII
jgi:hypothetical protein